MRVTLVVCGAVLALGGVGVTPAADACGMKGGGAYERENPILLVDRAAYELERNEAGTALTRLNRFRRSINDQFPKPLVERSTRLTARAVALANGEAVFHSLRESVTELEALERAHPDDPQVLTDLGLLLSRTPGAESRALRILESLATRDLMTTAHGWAALSMLRADPQAKRAAMDRCRLMTKFEDAVCVEGPAIVAPS